MNTEKDIIMTNMKKNIKEIPSGDLEIRVGRLEGTMESLAEEVKQTNQSLQQFAKETNQNINKLAGEVGHIKDALVKEIGDVKDAFSCQLTQKTKPDWGIILSIIGLLTTIIVMGATLVAFMFSGQTERINANATKMAVIEQEYVETNYQHGQIDQSLKNVEKEIQKLSIDNETLRLWKIEHIEEHAQCKEHFGRIQSDIEYLKKQVEKSPNINTISGSVQLVEP